MSTTEDSALAWLRDYGTAVKHGSFKPYSLTERKARAATHNQPWGPTGSELARLSELSFSPADCATILHVVDLRLSYPPKKWRNVYKGLTLLEYLLRHGSEPCVARARGALVPRLDSLAAAFTCVEANGRDSGANVRHRAQAILALLRDEPRLAAEREAHGKRRGAYQGFSSFDMAAQGGPQAPTEGWQAAAQDGGHLSTPVAGGDGGEEAQPGSPDYRERDPGDAALRNAGETKGVSMEENQRYLAALRRLLELPANRACADCGGAGAGSRPTWASINCGVFICMRCAGVHRGMGVHISKVRSCSLDTWLPEQVEFMARTGNALGNAYWEASLGQGQKPAQAATLPELEAYIRRKYVGKEFAAGVWPPAPHQLADGPELLAILGDFLPPERARQLLASQQAAEAEEQRRAEEGRRAAAAAAAAAINLMDFDAEPVAAPAGGQLGATLAPAQAQAADPMRSLEEAFTLGSPQGAAQTQGDSLAPSQPATNLGSWDIGAALAARQQPASEAAEAAAAAAAAQAAATQPPKPAPYCPPWAPQPSAAAPGSYAHMQLVPAGAAYDPAFHAGTVNGYTQHIAQPQASANPFAPNAGTYYAQLQPRQPQQQQQKAKPPPRPAPRAPASPAEAKAAELISRDLLAFNLHAETVSAINPPARFALHGHQQQAPAVPLRSPR